MLSHLRLRFRERIEDRISLTIGRRLVGFRVSTKDFPHYRFVDLFKAADEFFRLRGVVSTIQSQHQEDLNSILNGKCPDWASRQVKTSTHIAWPVDYNQEVSLPVDCFWVYKGTTPERRDLLIVRLRFDFYREKSVLEVASEGGDEAEKCLEWIVNQSIQASIFRNKILELAYEAGVRDEYGDIEQPSRLRVLFKIVEPVDDKDIIIDEEIRAILWRNVIDLHVRRELLKAHSVPVRRGILLYGPPGTGKTFACRYLCGKLPNTTRIIVTGTALHQVNSIFSLARMLQPSLVILEDVDLVFSARQINLYSSVLGDMLDQMDGLRPHEDIGFVLTTNAIDRMEAAIKDRPGRISQCVHFGAPQPELRKRYLMHYLRRYETSELDMDTLVRDSKGTTQAFLKEWVHRSVQIALERIDNEQKAIKLKNDDFERAMTEMRRYSEGETGRIIGFLGSG